MSEKLTFEQSFGQSGTIDRNKRLRGATAVAMNSARGELLSRAAFAGDQYGGIGLRDPRDAVAQLVLSAKLIFQFNKFALEAPQVIRVLERD